MKTPAIVILATAASVIVVAERGRQFNRLSAVTRQSCYNKWLPVVETQAGLRFSQNREIELCSRHARGSVCRVAVELENSDATDVPLRVIALFWWSIVMWVRGRYEQQQAELRRPMHGGTLRIGLWRLGACGA
jgi:hypothetical protein